jgi:hypothetical protein
MAESRTGHKPNALFCLAGAVIGLPSRAQGCGRVANTDFALALFPPRSRLAHWDICALARGPANAKNALETNASWEFEKWRPDQ